MFNTCSRAKKNMFNMYMWSLFQSLMGGSVLLVPGTPLRMRESQTDMLCKLLDVNVIGLTQ